MILLTDRHIGKPINATENIILLADEINSSNFEVTDLKKVK